MRKPILCVIVLYVCSNEFIDVFFFALFHRKICADHGDHHVCPRLIVEVGLFFLFFPLLLPFEFFIFVKRDQSVTSNIQPSQEWLQTIHKGEACRKFCAG